MRHYPAFLDIEERPCLVVGGGIAALGKVRLLRRAGAHVTVIARHFETELRQLSDTSDVVLRKRAFRAEDVLGRALVHAASGSAGTDEAVARAARAAKIPVNVVDRAALSSFIMPAIVDRGPLVIGISSGGASPVLARRVRAEIESILPHGLGRLARFAQKFRSAVQATFTDFETRLRFWENFFDSRLAEDVLQGGEALARGEMLSLVNGAQLPSRGDVATLEIDPFEADLLTLRDARLIARADVLVYGDAIAPAILDHARRDAERFETSANESEAENFIAARIRAGKRVVHMLPAMQIKHAEFGTV